MSMLYCFRAITPGEFENLLVNPHIFFDMIDDGLDDDDDEAEEVAEEESMVFLDKAWEAIVYLLSNKKGMSETGEKAFSKMLFSGQVFDEEQDLGYGPAQYLRPEQVAMWHERVKSIDRAEFLKHYDADRMNKENIYPGTWSDSDEDRDFLYEMFETLQQTFAVTAEKGGAIVAFLA